MGSSQPGEVGLAIPRQPTGAHTYLLLACLTSNTIFESELLLGVRKQHPKVEFFDMLSKKDSFKVS
jgi:hypothetical protein